MSDATIVDANEAALRQLLAGDGAAALATLQDGDPAAHDALAAGMVGTALARLRDLIAADVQLPKRPGLSGAIDPAIL